MSDTDPRDAFPNGAKVRITPRHPVRAYHGKKGVVTRRHVPPEHVVVKFPDARKGASVNIHHLERI